MAEHPNAALLRRLYQAFLGSESAPPLEELIAEDAMYVVTGSSPVAGVHKGPEGIAAHFVKLRELSGDTLQPFGPESFDVCASDHHAVLLDRFTATRDGKTLDSHEAVVVAFEDGKAKNLFHYFHDQAAFDAFWS